MRTLRSGVSSFVLALALAFTLRCAAAPVGMWWLLIPVLAVAIAFAGTNADGRRRRAFRRGWLFGTCFLVFDLAWIIGPAAAHLGPAMIPISLVLCALEALPIAIAALAFAGTEHRSPLGFCLGVPALYTLLETARSSGALGLPLATLGATQTSGPLAATLALGGIPLATFCAVVCAATIVFLIRGLRDADLIPGTFGALYLVLAVAVAAIAATNVLWKGRLDARSHTPVARIGIVQAGPIGLESSFAQTARAYGETTRRLPRDVDFALWPEGVLYLIATDAEQQRAAALSAAGALGRPLLAGATLRARGALHNDLVEIDGSGAVTSVYTKRRLVPFGEYQPFAFGATQRPAYDASSARLEAPVRIGAAAPFGALICYEVAFGDLTRDSANAGAAYLIAVLNDSWFGATDGPAQLAQLSQAHAIESGIPIVRVDTVGPSGAIDADGSWIGEPLRAAGTEVASVPVGISTPFRSFGRLPILLTFALIALATLRFPPRSALPN